MKSSQYFELSQNFPKYLIAWLSPAECGVGPKRISHENIQFHSLEIICNNWIIYLSPSGFNS